MSRTLPLIMILLLAHIPATITAEEAAPVNECRPSSNNIYLPATFVDMVAQTQQPQQSRQGPSEPGSDLRQADFNGDGCADLAVGAPNTRLGTETGPKRGAVQIFYGGNPFEPEISAPQTLLISNTPGSRFGFALATGDFNSDGYSDLAVSDPYQDVGGESDAGVVYVYYGSPTGLSATPRSIFHQDVSGVPGGVDAGDRLGWSLASGNFNVDGDYGNFHDLAIGVPYEDVDDIKDAGYIILLFGSVDGLVGQGAQGFTQDSPGVEGDPEEGDRFGWSMATFGSFYFGSGSKLAVSAPWDDVEFLGSRHGGVQLFNRESDGMEPSGQLTQNSPGVEGDPETDDLFGYALAAGDFDGDAYFDLVVATPNEDRSFVDNVGRVDIFYSNRTETWWQDDDGLPGSREENDYFGRAVAASDFDNDGFWDLAAGAPGEDVDNNSSEDSGALVILYGSRAGLLGDGSHFILMPGLVSGARLGHAITAGDFNKDGYVDLATGAPGANPPFDLPIFPNPPGQVLLNFGYSQGLDTNGRLLEAAPIQGYDLQSFGRSLR